MLILRLLPLIVLAASFTACTSVESAPPAGKSGFSYNPPVATSDRNAPERVPVAAISDEKPADIAAAPTPAIEPAIIEPEFAAEEKPYDLKETIVSRKIAQLRSDKSKIEEFYSSYESRLKDLQGRAEQNANNYYSTTALINARLQGGTTPGNPILVEQAQSAQQKLEALSNDISTLSVLANDISSNASVASYLLEAVRATYGLSGAVDEDHVSLTALEDEVNRLVVQIDRQLTDVNNDINRRTSYLATERRNLQTMTLAIANGELYGQSLANRAFFSPASALPGDPDIAAARVAPAAGFNPTKPLVVIRFDRPGVEFEQAVYLAASEALQRYPNVSFEVVAVAPPGSNPAQGSLANSDAQAAAQNVARSMTQMGVPGNRVKMSSTRSPMARSPEVHIFLR